MNLPMGKAQNPPLWAAIYRRKLCDTDWKSLPLSSLSRSLRPMTLMDLGRTTVVVPATVRLEIAFELPDTILLLRSRPHKLRDARGEILFADFHYDHLVTSAGYFDSGFLVAGPESRGPAGVIASLSVL